MDENDGKDLDTLLTSGPPMTRRQRQALEDDGDRLTIHRQLAAAAGEPGPQLGPKAAAAAEGAGDAELWTEDDLDARRQQLGPRAFAAQYAQHPNPTDDNAGKRFYSSTVSRGDLEDLEGKARSVGAHLLADAAGAMNYRQLEAEARAAGEELEDHDAAAARRLEADKTARAVAQTVHHAGAVAPALTAEGARVMFTATLELDGHLLAADQRPRHGEVASWLAGMADGCRLLALGLTMTANHLELASKDTPAAPELDSSQAAAPLELAIKTHRLADYNHAMLAGILVDYCGDARHLAGIAQLAHYQTARQHGMAIQVLASISEYHDGAPLELPVEVIRACGQLHGMLERFNSWAAQLHTEIGRQAWRDDR